MIADRIYKTYKAAIIEALTPEQGISFDERIKQAHNECKDLILDTHINASNEILGVDNYHGILYINDKIASLLLFLNEIDMTGTIGHDYQLLFDKDFDI